MSGITPLLDTLLHQVLGKRVDIPLPKDLNQPVSPPLSVEGARPLRSDSRLDARTTPQSPATLQADRARSQGVSESAVGEQKQLPRAELAPASTSASFSAAGRAIADLFQRFPAPSPAPLIAPSAALLAGGSGELPAVAQIAVLLERSIQGSGLFYESHVARWYRGGLPLSVLQAEPQMQGATPAGFQSPAEGGGQVSRSGDLARASLVDEVSAAEVGRGADVDAGIEDGGESVQMPLRESLSALVRQQLELLAVPSLRWEGEVWAGLFMGMTIQTPQLKEGWGREEGESPAGDDSSEAEWNIQLDLRLDGYDSLGVAMSMQGERLALTLQTESANLWRYIDDSREALQARLLGCGFSVVQLRLRDMARGEIVDG